MQQRNSKFNHIILKNNLVGQSDDNGNINPQNNNQFFIGNNYSPLIPQLDSKYIFYNFFIRYAISDISDRNKR